MNDKSKREDNTQLPDKEELTKILETEVHRPIPSSKANLHYPEFESIIKLLSYFGLSIELFTNDSLDIHDVVTQGQVLINEAIRIINSKPVQEKEVILFNNVYDYLSEQDEPHKSDIIFVFGAKTSLRAEKAAELFVDSLGKKL